MRPLGDDVDLARLGAYRGLDEIEAAFLALSGVRAGVAGESHQGRAVRRFELGPASAGRVSFVLSGLHALEWIGVETALAVAEDFAARPPDGLRLVVVPVANPDGYARAERDLREGRRRYVRANARGVDLNRNFPTHFRRRHLRSTLLPILGGPGAAPASEPETRAVLAALERERGRVARAVSLHSFGRKLLLPFGGRWRPPDDVEQLRALALEVSRALAPRYDVRPASHWLAGAFAFGLELDHLHALGIPALLVECSAGGLSLCDPTSWLHPFRWYNPPEPRAEARAIARALRVFLDPPAELSTREAARQRTREEASA